MTLYGFRQIPIVQRGIRIVVDKNSADLIVYNHVISINIIHYIHIYILLLKFRY